MIGISLRLALALGLHLRNEDPTLSPSRKETLVQAWWSLHSIECLVSTITGRPPVISFEDCTVPFPHAGSEEYPTTSTKTAKVFPTSGHTSSRSESKKPGKQNADSDFLFTSHIGTVAIAQKALLDLYSPRIAAKSWQVCAASIFIRSP